MMEFDKLEHLLTQVPVPPGEGIPAGVADDAINQFERRTGIPVPNDLRQWLKVSNGPCVGPGGLFGIGPGRTALDIEGHLDVNPSFLKSKWIPIAGDGCGNYYALATQQEFGPGYPVVFIEAVVDDESPAFIVASDLNHFLRFILEKELGQRGWPFDEQFVMRNDPQINEFHSVPMPWNAD